MKTAFYRCTVTRLKSRLIELSLTLAPLLLCACGTDTADGGGAGGPAAGKGGAVGAGGATGGAGGAAGGSAGATGGSGGASGGSGATGGSGGAAGGTGGSGGSGGATGGGSGGSGGGEVLPFALTSPAFEHVEDCSTGNVGACNVFPDANVMMTIGGDNVSPELNWGPGPAGTMSYAIVLHDYSNMYTHWAIWNISSATLQLPANLPRETNPATPAGAQQISFSDQDSGYMGPGANDHVYEFRLYALSAATFSPQTPGDQGAVRAELENDDGGIVLGTTDLRGKAPP